MTKKLHFLGTGCMIPTPQRNHLSVCLELNGELLLFDCGEHTQLQIRKMKLPLSKISKIFISHWHGDHVLGLPGLLMSLSHSQIDKEECSIEIHGPRGTLDFIHHMRKSMIFDSKIHLNVFEHTPKNDELREICSHSNYVVSCISLNHSVPCIAYTLKEKDTINVDMSKAKKLGLSSSPLLARTKMGLDIEVKGKIITPKEISYVKEGNKYTFIFDTRPCKAAELIAKNSTHLVMEATFLYKEHAQKAQEYDHMSAKETAEIALISNVGQLYITHFSQRYKDCSEIELEAKEIFEHTTLTHDLMSVVISK